ncbi:SPOR domain-containing protein [Hymenobacter sp. BRD128]|uniref:HU domain-containing protein n=1 Tax=Hymenobacter sp. BRD128 TaxID=2675878 RepID=UPI0015658204|nr:SPOR domain-containing protein [Hymenobacter sp. BRD128]QKG56465.1 SPOR domain-containing protein [Hymenobacter sp. BRD128]
MNLADHLRPLLRDHDCVIIPDFGGLVAEYTPARVQPGGRHVLSPPTRQVAFNQGLTRNDGLLVDVLRQHLGLLAAEAREALRQAVATLHRDLQTQQRAELPGIGVFRQLAGRGLQFEYTGTDNLLTAAFGLPELTVHPVSVTDARLAREQQAQLVPRLRAAGRGVRLRRAVPGAAIGLLAGLAVAGLYLLNLHPTVLPTAWQSHLPRWEQAASPAAPQQAALAQPSFAAPVAPVSLPAEEPMVSTSSPIEPVAEAVKNGSPTPAEKKVIPTVVAAKPAPPQTAPAQTDPVDALLARRAAPTPGRPRGKARKVPAAAAIALADESNIAKPVPLAMRKAGTQAPLLTTSYAAAMTAPRPAAVPTAPAAVSPLVNKKPTAAKALPAKPVAAAKPIIVAAKPLAVAKPALAKSATAAAAALDAGSAIKSRTGRYYLVVAAYGSMAHAEQGRRNLLHAGHANAKIILPYPGTRHYRLSAADFADRPAAQSAATQLRRNPHLDKGLTVFPY